MEENIKLIYVIEKMKKGLESFGYLLQLLYSVKQECDFFVNTFNTYELADGLIPEICDLFQEFIDLEIEYNRHYEINLTFIYTGLMNKLNEFKKKRKLVSIDCPESWTGYREFQHRSEITDLFERINDLIFVGYKLLPKDAIIDLLDNMIQIIGGVVFKLYMDDYKII